MLRSILAAVVVALSSALASDAACTAQNDCSACVDQTGGLFGSVSCSFCSSSGTCTTDMTASCSGQWVGYSSTCASCVSSCPAPTPPPTPPCHLPTTRDPNACKDNDSCKKACDAVSCMGGSSWSSSGGSKTCECIPNPCTNYPGCGKTYCTAMETEDEKHAARRSMLDVQPELNATAGVTVLSRSDASELTMNAIGDGEGKHVERVPKNATTVAGSTCDSYYRLEGGVRPEYRGRYERYGSASTSCSGKPVYQMGTKFLFHATAATGVPGDWWVGSEDAMLGCRAHGWIHSDPGGDCECPDASHCAGKWMQNTGQNNDGKMCDAPSWCPDCGLWWV